MATGSTLDTPASVHRNEPAATAPGPPPTPQSQTITMRPSASSSQRGPRPSIDHTRWIAIAIEILAIGGAVVLAYLRTGR